MARRKTGNDPAALTFKFSTDEGHDNKGAFRLLAEQFGQAKSICLYWHDAKDADPSVKLAARYESAHCRVATKFGLQPFMAITDLYEKISGEGRAQGEIWPTWAAAQRRYFSQKWKRHSPPVKGRRPSPVPDVKQAAALRCN